MNIFCIKNLAEMVLLLKNGLILIFIVCDSLKHLTEEQDEMTEIILCF